MVEPEKQQNTTDIDKPNYKHISEAIGEESKFLLAEDNKVNVRLFCYLFNRLGHESTYQIAWNGQEAVDMYKAYPERYKLILMDVSMPIMGGMQASLLIREHERKNNLQPTIIVGLVAGSINGEKERLISDFGMNDVLSKPCKLEKLRQLLQDWQV